MSNLSIQEKRSGNIVEQQSTRSTTQRDVVNVPTEDAHVQYVTWLSDDLHNMTFFRVPCKNPPTDVTLAASEHSDDSMPELEADNGSFDDLSDSDDQMPELESVEGNDS